MSKSNPLFQVDDLLVLEEQLDVDVRSLDVCQYAHSTFAEILNKIQKAVDDLSLHQYSNLHIWVQRLDEQVRVFVLMKWIICTGVMIKEGRRKRKKHSYIY